MLQLTENARIVLERRYLDRKDGKLNETPEEMVRRVAKNVAAVEAQYDGDSARWEREFADIIDTLEFLPNSPTLMNAGRSLQQLAACFVLPIEDSMEGIFETLKNTALIQKSGGGTGFSFSRLRPKTDRVSTTGGQASGPVSFLKCFNAATDAVKQGGTRRGANMGILRVDHPDILEFIQCKADNKEITNFNISVAITEQFMAAVLEEKDYDLISPRTGEVVGQQSAKDIFELIVDMAWKNGEPGIVFIDRINRANPTPHVGEIEATNPCGEQPLLPNESCNLGSINLSKMVRPVDGKWELDKERLTHVVQVAVRFLDNVIDANRYPIAQIEEMTKANRKIGLGVMGFADLLIRLGIPYNSEEGVRLGNEVMGLIWKISHEESGRLAAERGVFPNYVGSVFEQDGKKMRNATVTTIAPTGTISIIGGASSGIEPLFALAFTRNVMDNDKLVEVNPLFEEILRERGIYSKELIERVAQEGSVKTIDAIPEDLRRVFVTAHDIAPEWHIKMQAAFQQWTDNAVSKTVNFPSSATRAEIAEVYNLAYSLGCKGITVYRSGSREGEVLTVGNTTSVSPSTKHSPRRRPKTTRGVTERMKTGCGTLYVTINEDEQGICEVFTTIGKAGGCAAAFSETTARLISLTLRSGIEPAQITRQLKGIRCPHPMWQEGKLVMSCPDAIAQVIARYIDEKGEGDGEKYVAVASEFLKGAECCPECGGAMKHESGCATCVDCGFSRCG